MAQTRNKFDPILTDSLGDSSGAIAQLGERLLCKQDVVGSIPSGSTNTSGGLVITE